MKAELELEQVISMQLINKINGVSTVKFTIFKRKAQNTVLWAVWQKQYSIGKTSQLVLNAGI